MIMFHLRQHRNKSGFSLIEIITVLLVISIGMAGTLTLVTQSIQGQNINKNTLIAYQLAQEGVEFVRLIRDNNWRSHRAWDESLNDGDYGMDYDDILWPMPSVSFQGRLAAGRLLIDENGFYASSPTVTALPENQYSRIISITHDTGDSAKIKVKVNVYWFDRGQLSSYSLETDLYDWL